MLIQIIDAPIQNGNYIKLTVDITNKNKVFGF